MPIVSSVRRISSELRRDKGKPVVRRGTQSYGPRVCEAAELPNRVVEKRRRLLDMDEQDSAVLSEAAIGGASLLLLQAILPRQCRRLTRAKERLQQALEEVESALVECEEVLSTALPVPPVLRSVPPERSHGRAAPHGLRQAEQVCQELGMGKSWVYHRIKSGEIPSVKLGRNIKVKREDLDQYLENQRYQPSGVA